MTAALGGAGDSIAATYVHPAVNLVPIRGNVLPALKQATLVEKPGAVQAEANKQITVTMVLKRDRQQAFERYLKEVYRPQSLNYRHFLTQREIADRFGPSRAEYEELLGYLRSHGFKLLVGSENRLTLTMRGTRGAAERAFDVDIRDYRIGKRKFRANDRNPALPVSIAPRVQAIVGLSNLAQPVRIGSAFIIHQLEANGAKCKDTESGEELPCTCKLAEAFDKGDFGEGLMALGNGLGGGAIDLPAISPITTVLRFQCAADVLNMVAAYAAQAGGGGAAALVQRRDAPMQAAISPSSGPGSGQKIGLVEFDNFHMSDVQNFLNLIGYPARIGQLSEVDVSGGAGAPGPGESEVLLDIDAVMSLAPGAQVVVYDAPFSGRGSFQSVFNAMINDGDTVISNSWAYCEDQTDGADLSSLNAVLANAAAAGITVVTATGDTGSTCLDGRSNTLSVPADQPDITAVGGTSPTLNEAGTYGSESWWSGSNDTPPTGQGGFGVSAFFTRPAYQNGLNTMSNRSAPDLATTADPSVGYFICEADRGGCPAPLEFGGTSVAAPIAAAMAAVLNEQMGHNLGFLNPLLYPLAGTTAFHSAASMGTDFAHVGLGSPNLSEIHRLLAGETVGPVSITNSVIAVANSSALSDGVTHAGVAVVLLDGNFNTVGGQSVTLSANSGSHAVITTVRGTTDRDSGAALFQVSDTVPETVTLTASTSAGQLADSATVNFVSPPATGGSIQAAPASVTADGTSTAVITVTLASNSQPSPGKVVGLSQGNGSSQISGTTGVTDSTGTVSFTATDSVQENVTYTATDITDGNLRVPGSAMVDFTNAPSAPPCKIGLGTVAPGFAVSTFASGFAFDSNHCFGPIGLAFDPQGNLLVADSANNVLYKFSPAGGSADPGHEVGPTGLTATNGLVFTKDGSLFASDPSNGTVVELDPSTGASTRTVASSLPVPIGLAADPISGNLFFSAAPQFCFEGTGWWEISNFLSGPGTAAEYATEPSCINLGGDVPDGITFARDGILYTADESDGRIFTISGTNSATPGTVTQIAQLSGHPDGITLAQNPSSPSNPYVYVSANDGTITRLDTTTSPPTETTIYSGGSRGDFVTVGPDGCMYATQTDRVIKITNADGSCSFEPVTVAPAIALQPAVVSPNPTQGSTIALTAQLQNVSNSANVPVQLVVGGANPRLYGGSTDVNGSVTFTLSGVHSGADQAIAVSSPNGTELGSNLVKLQWSPGPHSTFIGLNQSQGMGTVGQPITLIGTLVDISADPAADLSGQTLNFNLGGQSCSGTTDSTGTATCAVTPSAAGVFTLAASFGGSSSYVASSSTKRVTLVTSPPPPTATATPTPTPIATATATPTITATPTATPTPGGNVALESPGSGSAGPGKTISGGTLDYTNDDSVTQTISSLTLSISDPKIFSRIVVTPGPNGSAVEVNAPNITSTTVFSFSPAITVAANARENFTITAELAGGSQARMQLRGIAFAGINHGGNKAGAGGTGVPWLLFVGVAILFAIILMPVGASSRGRKIAMVALVIVLGTGAFGCGGNSGPSGLSSSQAVISVSVTEGAKPVGVSGLPLRLGTIRENP